MQQGHGAETKISLVFVSRCTGGDHYKFTATVSSEANAVLLTTPIVLTMDQMLGVDPSDAISQIPYLLRQLFLEGGYNRLTPLGTLRTAIEAKVFRV